ncbi:hypothetical protein BDFB_012228 [Asbolus verrucosus]|uniref:Integrase SAM-like N-terminal domain-containing protein n=1 Tax=Asbolus verrucosus TaxID=1661398 RepID=A0A482W094_ASBVE|nr:hypothetical protein BDFB_012228 [Asbolus verrucosus]
MTENGIPTELLQDAKAAIENLLPAKSKALYEKTYGIFKDWYGAKKVKEITEDVILAYLEQRSRQVKPSTIIFFSHVRKIFF